MGRPGRFRPDGRRCPFEQRHRASEAYMMAGMRTRRQLLLTPLLAAGCRRTGWRVIGVVPKATSHLFFVAVHAGVNAAAKEAGVTVLWNGPSDETDHARQIQVVDAMVAQRV